MKKFNLDDLNPTLEDINMMEEEQNSNETTEYGCNEKNDNRSEKNEADDFYLGNSM